MGSISLTDLAAIISVLVVILGASITAIVFVVRLEGKVKGVNGRCDNHDRSLAEQKIASDSSLEELKVQVANVRSEYGSLSKDMADQFAGLREDFAEFRGLVTGFLNHETKSPRGKQRRSR